MNSTQQWQSVTWFDVDEHQEGQRIDNFLFTRLKGVPKSRIYRLIREGQVRVNKKRIKAVLPTSKQPYQSPNWKFTVSGFRASQIKVASES